MDLPVKNIVSEIDLKHSDVFLPLFESIVNAIISLKKTNIAKEQKKIQVQITRGEYPSNQLLYPSKKIDSIKIIDNGQGFNDANLASFRTAYSRENVSYGCKGIGRFTILAAFEKILIRSTYQEGNAWRYREIEFDAENEVSLIAEDEAKVKEAKTIVELINFNNTAVADYTAIPCEEIAAMVMQHCLIYYLCNDLPRIEIFDTENDQLEVVNEMYSAVSKEREKDFDVKDEKFKYYVTRTLKTNNRKNHYIYYCANSRVVGSGKSIAKVNSIFAYPIVDNSGAFFLDIYVVSDYLNKKVYSARNGFTIPQESMDDLFNAGGEITFFDIESVIGKLVEGEYDSFVKATQDRKIKELKSYISNHAPRYKRYLNRPEILDAIPPNLTDDKKEEYLYKISFAERKAIDNKIDSFIATKNVNEDSIESIKEELVNKTAYDSDNLSDYMFRRKAIIDLFKKFLEADASGQYRLEEDIHNLIFPMGVTQDKVDYESHNLWLLDQRFVSYSFIGSDTPITSFSQKKSGKEPDIIMIDTPKMFENPISFAANPSGEISSMVIFEFKRPGETAHQKRKADYRWELSELVDKYFDEFIYGQDKKNYRGRPVVVHKSTPKFGYIVVDVIPTALKDYNLGKGFKATPFGTLYKINPELNLHIEVITFEQLVKAAEGHHAPFFDKLFNGV